MQPFFFLSRISPAFFLFFSFPRNARDLTARKAWNPRAQMRRTYEKLLHEIVLARTKMSLKLWEVTQCDFLALARVPLLYSEGKRDWRTFELLLLKTPVLYEILSLFCSTVRVSEICTTFQDIFLHFPIVLQFFKDIPRTLTDLQPKNDWIVKSQSDNTSFLWQVPENIWADCTSACLEKEP